MSGKAILKEIGSTLLYIVVVLGITWLVITFVGQRTEVNGSSMEPTPVSYTHLDVYKRQSCGADCSRLMEVDYERFGGSDRKGTCGSSG